MRRATGHQLGRHHLVHRKGGPLLEQPNGGLHEDAGTARTHEEDVRGSVVEGSGHLLVDATREAHGTGLDAQIAVVVEVQHAQPLRPVRAQYSTLNM